ncbi:TRAUB-domain-containing protein [Pleomassaria siparia CBS 279.74]|uniref:Protein BFR2 n=1 Tax=Pleomassaria siparia CBS 279.74 TaxID=1314801 RepID=A0A6G1KLU7_9PLEO|nr:TRAUB-domain-containing protein [Pleomassaria siparia CBS 279.74]
MGRSKLKDFDPESLLDPAPSSSDDDENSASGSESEDEGKAGRGHYTNVGTSKLRKPEAVPLGSQYTGSRISRNAAEDEDSDDPFARGFDDAGDSEESVSDLDEYRKGISKGEESEEDEIDGENENGDEQMEGFDSEDQDENDEDVDDEDADEKDQDTSDTSDDEDGDEDEDDTSKLRKMMKKQNMDDNSDDEDDQSKIRDMFKEQGITAQISQAAVADVTKGQAIKSQRKIFDTLLNTRIRLQKALISTNSMAADSESGKAAPEVSIEAAETAALTLLNNLTNLRSTLDSARAGDKRKRTEFTRATSSSEIWSSMQATEPAALSHRKAILEKWSVKTRGATVKASKSRLNTSVGQTLTDVLTSQLQDMPRLVARTQVPRSCAPLQSAANTSSKDIYDDADLYGLLLKELLEQRSADLNTSGTSEFVVQQPWQVAREAKTRKVVDTKASKGRKLRYTVHEKLQNFMAPEERGDWGDRQRDELFGSLFGARMGLGEDVDEVMSEGEDGDAAEEGLMLFRS